MTRVSYSLSFAVVAALAGVCGALPAVAQDPQQWSLSPFPAESAAGSVRQPRTLQLARAPDSAASPAQAFTGYQQSPLSFLSQLFGGGAGSAAESACGLFKLSEIQSFKGTEIFPKLSVASLQRATVRISFQDAASMKGVADHLFNGKRYDLRELPLAENQGVCTGTMIAKNLVLTAGHCVDVDYYEKEHNDHMQTPRVYGRERPRLSANELGQFLQADFNHQLSYAVADASAEVAGPQAEFSAKVIEVISSNYKTPVPYQVPDRDYAILRLDVSGVKPLIFSIGLSKMDFSRPQAGRALAIIQHPLGSTKQIGTGSVQSAKDNRVFYANLSTEGGSSGAGVLTSGGRLLAVHTRGPVEGCNPNAIDPGDGSTANQGMRLAAIRNLLKQILAEDTPAPSLPPAASGSSSSNTSVPPPATGANP